MINSIDAVNPTLNFSGKHVRKRLDRIRGTVLPGGGRCYTCYIRGRKGEKKRTNYMVVLQLVAYHYIAHQFITH